MLSRSSVAPFLSGAAFMLLLVIVLLWAVPAWLPAGGLVLRIGPYRASADAPAAVPARVAVATPAAMQPSAEVERLKVQPPAAPPPPADSASAPAAGVPAGVLMVPVRGVRPDQLVDTYSAARGQGRVHDAIDIAAPGGTPVLATADGVVLKLFQSDRGGITLYELAPDQRTIYYYAHLQRYAGGMAQGRPLRRGDVLGYVGDSGNAGAGNTHLHFEVSTTADPRRYWAGTPQNPYPLLRAGVAAP